MNKENGGPAFPVPPLEGQYSPHSPQGMTLRDYFAAKAMQGYMVGTEKPCADRISETAYEIADAMLAERAKS